MRSNGEAARKGPRRKDAQIAHIKRCVPGSRQKADIAERSVNGINFVSLDNSFGGVSERQVALFAEEEKKGLPIVLCMHVPFFTPFILTAKMKFAKNAKGFDGKVPEPRRGDHKRQLSDPVTRDFIAHLKEQPLLKAILAGHLHIGVEERFSSTAMQYVVAGNYSFHTSEILFT